MLYSYVHYRSWKFMMLWSTFGAMSWQHCFCARFMYRSVALQDNLLDRAWAFVMVRILSTVVLHVLEFSAVESVNGIFSEHLEFSIEVVQSHHLKVLYVRARIIIWRVGQFKKRKTARNAAKRLKITWYLELLRWSTGNVLAFGTQVRGFKTDRSRWIFQREKNPSFGREVKPFVPCRIFAACKRTRKYMRGSRSFRSKLPAISRPSSFSFHY